MAKVIIFDTDEQKGKLLSRKLCGAIHPLGFDKLCTFEEDAIEAISHHAPWVVIICIYRDEDIGFALTLACLQVDAEILVVFENGYYKNPFPLHHRGNVVERDWQLDRFKSLFDKVYNDAKVKSVKQSLPALLPDVELFDEEIKGVKVRTATGFKWCKPENVIRCTVAHNGVHVYFANNQYYYTPRSIQNLLDDFPNAGFIRTHQSGMINVNHISADDDFNLNTILMDDLVLVEPSRDMLRNVKKSKVSSWREYFNSLSKAPNFLIS